MPSISEKAELLWSLHDHGCLVLPNCWDLASAALISAEKFPVLATTSAGVAFALGHPDGEVLGRDEMVAFAGRLANRFDLPVTADLEAGYGPSPDDVAATVRAAVEVGIVGCNIEDGVPGTLQLFDRAHGAARVRGAVEAARGAGLEHFCVNARVDSFIRQIGDPGVCLEDAIARGRAYLAEGARSVFVPGVVDLGTVSSLIRGIGGPLNIMAVGGDAMPPIGELAAAGVRRISLGGAMMSAAYGTARGILRSVKQDGTLACGEGVTFRDFMALMSPPSAR